MSLINVPNIYCDTKCLQNKDLKELYDNYDFVKQQLSDEVNSSKNYYTIPNNNNSNATALLIKSNKKKKIINDITTNIYKYFKILL